METSQPFIPVDSIPYTDKSVVSEIILKKPTGSVALFVFGVGEGLAEYTTSHEVLFSKEFSVINSAK